MADGANISNDSQHGTNRQPTEEKIPISLEAEQAILGAILFDNEIYYRVSAFLKPEHFFDPVHQLIFDACGRLINSGRLAAPTIVDTFLAASEGFREAGGRRYLEQLAANVPATASAHDYARVVFDLAVCRGLIKVGSEMIERARETSLDDEPARQLEDAEQALYTLAETGKYGGGFKSFRSAITEAIELADAAVKREGGLAGVASGLRDLDTMLGGLHASDLIILAGRPSMGKAQPLDAKILAKAGWKEMGELRVGDELASVDGARSRVRAIFPQGKKQIFRVTFADGRSTECCEEHLWRIYYRGWPSARTLATKDLTRLLERKRYRNRIWIDVPSGHFGAGDELPVDPWTLGALLGDGKLSGGSLLFSTADAEMLSEIQIRLGEGFALASAGGYDYRVKTAGGHRRKGVQGVVPNALKTALVRLGLWDIRSEEKFVPTPYLAAGRTQRVDLLRGLLDTDGWVERWGSVRFCTTSRRLAENVVEIVRSLGGQCSIAVRAPKYTYRGETRDGLPAYVLTIQNLSAEELFSLPRKKARMHKPTRIRRLTVKSIEPTRLADAQCITVTHPSQLYITDQFVVTHNTSLATNIAVNAAKAYRAERQPDGSVKAAEGAIIGLFSLEMAAEQIATRIISEVSGVPSNEIRRGDVDQEAFDRVYHAARELENLPLHIDDTGGLSIAQIAARARRLKRQHGLGLLVIDYLQLITGSGKRSNDNRVQEVTEISMGLKALAKELNVPVLACSQLSRQVESRDDKRPQLADLRESGSIEQDADVVLFVFREEYYLKRGEPREGTPEWEEWRGKCDEVHGIAEIIIGKQRHGPIGKVELHFNEKLTKFSNLDRGMYDEYRKGP